MFIATQYRTLAEFEAQLARTSIPGPPGWPAGPPTGIRIHHTWKPRQDQWHGYGSMRGLATYYESLGWDRGPHVFLCSGAKDPADDGIWILSPLDQWSIHAGGNGLWGCNSSTISIEVVGDYDLRGWDTGTTELTIGTLAAVCRWLQIEPAAIAGHRDCGSPKTCPGKQIDLAAVRALVEARLAAGQPQPAIVFDEHASILAGPRCTMAQAARFICGPSEQPRPTGEYTRYDIARVILPEYWRVCGLAQVDPCMAVAQLCHETGQPTDPPPGQLRARALYSYWSQRPRRNPAGIGVTSPHVGISFDRWDKDTGSVTAHIGRLVAYATRPDERTQNQRMLVALALAHRGLHPSMYGSAETIEQLGAAHNPTGQGWAKPGTTYGIKLAQIMTAIASTVV